jgi:hypothetical protein
MSRRSLERLEQALVVLIALHSYGVALALLAAPRWSAALGGWGELAQPFFARQGGVFHAVVATGYLLEYFRHRGVGLLLTAKAVATVFLAASALADPTPWALPLAAFSDGLMGLAVLLVHRRLQQAR